MAELSKEKETLLIPLYGKAQDYKRKNSILKDKMAAKIIAELDYDFSSLAIPEKTNVMLCIRAKIMDDQVRQHLSDGMSVLHLGCGLDSRYVRIGQPPVDWYDVDFEEVIELRKQFFNETDRYRMVGSSVVDVAWLESLQSRNEGCMVIAEGLFMYLDVEEIKSLIGRIREKMGPFRLVFDAYSTLTAKSAAKHPSLKKTGAVIKWGMDSPLDMENWGIGIRVEKEIHFADHPSVDTLPFAMKAMFKLAGKSKTANRAHRIIVCAVG